MTQIVWGQGEDGDMFSFENFGKHVQVICTSNMKIFFGKYSLKDRGYFNYYVDYEKSTESYPHEREVHFQSWKQLRIQNYQEDYFCYLSYKVNTLLLIPHELF